MYQLILLDRDGVINVDSPDYIKSPEQWRPIEGALPAIATLTGAGVRVCVCTNQAGVGRGLFSLEDLNAIHLQMHDALAAHGSRPLDGVFFCPHTPEDTCHCRKPKPGLLLRAMHDRAIAPEHTCFVGDSMKDIQAAIAARCQPILVLTGNGRITRDALSEELAKQVPVYQDLSAFAAAVTHR